MKKPRRPTAFARALVAALGLLAASCRGEPAVELPGEDRLLESLMEDYVVERFRFYPVESTLAGLPGNDDRLGSFSRTDVERRIDWLADFHLQLIGVDLDALSRPAYLDALWLTSLVKAELLDLEERRLWETSARFYTEPIRTGLTSLLLDPDVASRTGALAGRLDAVPTLLDQAKENLHFGAGLWRSEGLAALALCRTLLAELPQLLSERVPAYRVAELAERSRTATRALASLEHLVDGGSASRELDWAPLGSGTLERYFLYSEMVDAPTTDILAEAREALEVTTNDLIALALERFAGESLPALLAHRPAGAGPRETVEAAEAWARGLADGLGEPFPLARPIPVVSVAPYFVAPDTMALFRPAALEPAKGPFVIVDVASPAPDEASLRLRTLGEVAVRYRRFVFQARSTSLLRRVFATRTTTEGFRGFSLSRLLERGAAEDAPELELRFEHDTLLELLRLVATVELNAGSLELDEAAALFRDRGFLRPELAQAEAERAALDPAVGSPALGRLVLTRLVRDYFRAHPLASEPELERRLLSQGALPIRLLRFELLGIEPPL